MTENMTPTEAAAILVVYGTDHDRERLPAWLTREGGEWRETKTERVLRQSQEALNRMDHR